VYFDGITTTFLTYKITEISSYFRKFHPGNPPRKKLSL
jgi:hypothetical protein